MSNSRKEIMPPPETLGNSHVTMPSTAIAYDVYSRKINKQPYSTIII